jgi:Bardet-Biedl syndrome 4 protein
LLGAGSLLQERNEIDQAVAKYKYALTISPNSAFLWNNIGMSFFEKKKFIAAYTCLKKSLYLDPFQWKVYANLGMVCIELEKYNICHTDICRLLCISAWR